MVFSHQKVVNSFTTIYYVLLQISKYPPRQIWQVWARAPLRAGSESRLYGIPVRQGTNLNPALVKDAITSAALKGGWGVAGGPVGQTRSGLGLSWEVVALAAASSPPALFDSSESNLNAAGRPGGSLRKAHEVFKARGLVPPPEPLVLCMHMSVKHTGFFE